MRTKALNALAMVLFIAGVLTGCGAADGFLNALQGTGTWAWAIWPALGAGVLLLASLGASGRADEMQSGRS
jgi:hypothetical protein